MFGVYVSFMMLLCLSTKIVCPKGPNSSQVLAKKVQKWALLKREASTIKGESSIPLIQKNMSRIFDEKVEEFSHKDLMIFPSQELRFTFKETKEHTHAFGSGLLDCYIKRPRQMVSMLENEAENQTTSLACAKIGVGFIPCPPDASLEKFAEIMDLTTPYGLIINPKVQKREELQKLMPELTYWRLGAYMLRTHRFPSLRNIIHIDFHRMRGMVTFSDIMLYERRPVTVPKASAQVQPTDPLYVVPTSATSALIYDHHNVANLSYFVGKAIQLGINDRVLLLLPNSMEMFTLGSWSCMQHGAVLIVPKNRTSPEASTTFKKEECNTIICDMKTLSSLLEDSDSHSKLNVLQKVFIVDQEQPSSELIKKLQQFPQLKHIFSFNVANGVVFDETTGKGQVLAHIETRVVDSSGNLVEYNTEGQLQSKGYHVPKTMGSIEIIGESGWMNSKLRVKMDQNGVITRV